MPAKELRVGCPVRQTDWQLILGTEDRQLRLSN
jgi:hypothetical protein